MARTTLFLSYQLALVACIFAIFLSRGWVLRKSSIVRRILFWASRIIFVILFGAGTLYGMAVGYVLLISRHVPISAEKATRETSELIKKAGGGEEIRKEAREVFAHLGSKDDMLLFQEMKAYPALESLNVTHWSPPNLNVPACLRARQGDHFSGYSILIFNPDDERKPVISPQLIEVSPSICVGL